MAADDEINGPDMLGSQMPSIASDALRPWRGGYGQNAFSGPSSVCPDDPAVESGFLPAADLDAAQADRRNIQQRPISADPLPTTFGMRKA